MFLSATWVLNLGGDKRDRTADLLNAIQALSQLSYTPTSMNPLISNGFVTIQFSFCGFRLGPFTGGCALPAELYPHIQLPVTEKNQTLRLPNFPIRESPKAHKLDLQFGARGGTWTRTPVMSTRTWI